MPVRFLHAYHGDMNRDQKLLLVEDNPTIVAALEKAGIALNLQIEVATDGWDAIEKLRRRVGADTPLKTFKKHVAAIIKSRPTPLPSYGLVIVDAYQLGKNDTPLSPLPLKRTALKRLQVYFFPLGGITAPVMSAPLVEDDA